MRIADTSLLYALFSSNDVHHDEAMEEMRDPETILIPSEIWFETISLIHHRQGFGEAVDAGNFLLQLPHIELLPSRMDIMRASWNTYRRSKGELSFVDCVVVSWCLDMKAHPLTFDEDIARHLGTETKRRSRPI